MRQPWASSGIYTMRKKIKGIKLVYDKFIVGQCLRILRRNTF